MTKIKSPPFARVAFTVAVGLLMISLGSCRRGDVPLTETTKIDGAANPSAVTFNRDVAPIVFANCVTCHRPGEAAPFSLLTYDDVRKRAKQIADVTRRRFMPPWLPAERHGDFAGARRLTEPQIEVFDKWAKAGAPRGDESDLPNLPTFAEGWQLGKPDLVLATPPYSLSSDGGDQFRNFVIPVTDTTPQWVESIELRPTNPRATHHARLGVDRSLESMRRDAADPEPGYEGMAWGQDPDGQLVTWVPGMVAHPAITGSAWRLYPRTCLVLHTHMQPTGKPETVQFHVGIHFAKQPPTERPVMMRIGSRDIDIRAGDANYVATDVFAVPADLDLHSIFPHAHSLCREARVDAELPDATTSTLIWIKDFDEKWHDQYRYKKPVRLPRGTILRTTFRYDNTDQNIRNRQHPPKRVVFGSNVVDEMQDVYLQVTTVKPDERAAFLEDFNEYDQRSQLIGFNKTLEIYPNDPWSREGIAASYMSLGKPADAIRWLEERLKLGIDPNFATVALAMACLATSNTERAEKLSRDAIARDAEYPLAWLALGRALDARNKSKEAENAYLRAVELAPALTDARIALADNLMKQNQPDAAVAACEEAIRFSPDTANLYLKLAGVQARERHYDDALRNLELARQLAPYTHPPKVLLAVFHNQNGDPSAAKKLLQEAHAEAPEHPVPELFLGQFALRDKQLTDARKFFNAAASRLIPTNWPQSHRKRFLVLLHTERFKLAQALQDKDLARSAVTEWIKYDPDNRQLRQIYESFAPAGN
jgi:tetratricopeptide (TPR) repeat protein